MIRKIAHPGMLAVVGLGFLSAAAWVVALPLGLAAVGASLVIIEWRVAP